MVENKKYSNYSVLMSVYYKEKAIHLDESMQSIFNQTILTNDFVLVCDGTLTSELDTVIGKYQKKYPNILNIKRLKTNKGLGNALNEGLNLCKNELVARMDSDDIAKIDRCEKELNAFNNNQNISIVGSAIEEFVENTNQVVNIKRVPSDYLEIIKFSKKRNPFNHPSVMFKKSDIISDSKKTECENKSKKNNQVKQVRDYMLSLNSFTTKQLRQHFPNLASATINNALSLAKAKGLIKSVARGQYKVLKD